MLYIIIGFFLVCIDQLSKFLIADFFAFGQRYPVISGFFYLTNISNKGAAWGMLEGGKWFFIAVTVITIIIMLFMFAKLKRFSFRMPMIMIISGGIGNMIDRLFRTDGVLDFLEFHFGDYIFPVFNFADICVTLGAFFLVLVLWFGDRENKDVDNDTIDDEDIYDDYDEEFTENVVEEDGE